MRGMVVGEVQLMLLALRVEGVGGGPISRKKALRNTWNGMAPKDSKP